MLYDLPEYIGNMKFENEKKKHTRDIVHYFIFEFWSLYFIWIF